jgi:hypothetical protein
MEKGVCHPHSVVGDGESNRREIQMNGPLSAIPTPTGGERQDQKEEEETGKRRSECRTHILLKQSLPFGVRQLFPPRSAPLPGEIWQ